MRDTAPPAAGHGQGTGMRWVRSIRRVPGVQGVPPSGSGQAKTRRRGATDVSLPSGALLYIEGVRCSAVRRSVGFRSDTPRTSLISINACGWRSRFTIDRPRVPRRPPRRALPRGYPQNAAYPQPAMACRTALRVLRPCIAAMMSDFQLPRRSSRISIGRPSAPARRPAEPHRARDAARGSPQVRCAAAGERRRGDGGGNARHRLHPCLWA